jgi:hypothetical protein
VPIVHFVNLSVKFILIPFKNTHELPKKWLNASFLDGLSNLRKKGAILCDVLLFVGKNGRQEIAAKFLLDGSAMKPEISAQYSGDVEPEMTLRRREAGPLPGSAILVRRGGTLC